MRRRTHLPALLEWPRPDMFAPNDKLDVRIEIRLGFMLGTRSHRTGRRPAESRPDSQRQPAPRSLFAGNTLPATLAALLSIARSSRDSFAHRRARDGPG